MDLILLGAGGQAKDVIKNIEEYNMNVPRNKRANLIGCIDDINKVESSKEIAGYPVFNSIKILKKPSLRNVLVLSAVGDPVNKKIFIRKIMQYRPKFFNLIHPSVLIHSTTKLGVGISIFSSSIVSAFSQIEDHVSINYLCSVSHDCIIKSYATLCPGVNVGGRSILEEGTLMGINSCCINRIKIDSWSVIGAGTTVNKDVPAYTIVVGNPYRIIGKRNKNIPII